MTITKASLIKSISDTANFSKQKSSTVVESLLEIIKQTLESGEDVLISGFGTFSVKDKQERKGRNPATGNDLILDARRIVTFRCSNVLRDKINLDKG